MGKKLSEEELNNASKEILVALIMSLQDQLASMTEQTVLLNQRIDYLSEQIAAANNYRFGRHTEKLDQIVGQLDFFNEMELTMDVCGVGEEPKLEEVVTIRRSNKRKGKRDEDLKDIPAVVTDYTIEPSELDEKLGHGWKELPFEVSRQLQVKPMEFTVDEQHIHVYASRDGQTMLKADHPKKLIRNSLVSPSVGALILNGKFVNGMPGNRMVREFEYMGIHVTRQDVARWNIALAERYLAIMYDWLHQRMYHYHVLHADETPILVAKDGKPTGSKSWMWVYRTGELHEHPIVLYEYQTGRSAEHPRNFLKDFSGVLVCDGYQVYHKIGEEKEELQVAGCWVHAKRYFAEALKASKGPGKSATIAGQATERIAEMFHQDNLLKELPPEERLKKRQEIIKPLVEAYFEWLKSIPGTRKSKTSEGITYSLNQEKYLRKFLEDPYVPMDNNAAERAIRPCCIGKKNWYVTDTISGAKASAIAYSIAETAKANHIRPLKYFEHLLTEIPKHLEDTDRSFLERLAPWSADLPEECRRILN